MLQWFEIFHPSSQYPSEIKPAANVVFALLSQARYIRQDHLRLLQSVSISIPQLEERKIAPVSHRLITPDVLEITWLCDCCHRNEIAKWPIVTVTRNSRSLF